MCMKWSWCACRGAWRLYRWVAPGVLQAGRDGHRQRDAASTPSTDATMAREQPNVGDLLPLLETSDLHQLEEIRGLINEQLSTGMAAWFVQRQQGSPVYVELSRELWEIVMLIRNILPCFRWRARVHAAERAGGLLFGNKLCPGYAYPLLSQRATR